MKGLDFRVWCLEFWRLGLRVFKDRGITVGGLGLEKFRDYLFIYPILYGAKVLTQLSCFPIENCAIELGSVPSSK